MDVVGWGRSGEQHNVSIPGEEVSMELFRNRLQVHLLHTPHLQARLLACRLELFVEHHGSGDNKKMTIVAKFKGSEVETLGGGGDLGEGKDIWNHNSGGLSEDGVILVVNLCFNTLLTELVFIEFTSY